MDLDQLAAFLKAAKKATYANPDAPKAQPTRPGSENYRFQYGDFIYEDSYFGSRDFIGEEIVSYRGVRCWGMNYYGTVLIPSVSTEDAYRILRPALAQNLDDIIPVRGPHVYIDAAHEYENSVEGTLQFFHGSEEICIGAVTVYRGFYHGGRIG